MDEALERVGRTALSLAMAVAVVCVLAGCGGDDAAVDTASVKRCLEDSRVTVIPADHDDPTLADAGVTTAFYVTFELLSKATPPSQGMILFSGDPAATESALDGFVRKEVGDRAAGTLRYHRTDDALWTLFGDTGKEGDLVRRCLEARQ